jgi:hypothetical protein
VWLAALLFGTAAWLYAPVLSANRSHPWRPLSIPFSVSPGAITTPKFQVHFTGDYYVGLETRSKADLETLQSQPDIIDVSWQLLEGGNPVQVAPTVFLKGNSREYSSYPIQSDSQLRQIGRFRGGNNHSYQLVLHVEKGAPQIHAGNPSLVVEVEPSAAKDYFVGLYLRRDLAKVLAISAVLITIFSIRWRPPFHPSRPSSSY